jgi:hypothetical protein
LRGASAAQPVTLCVHSPPRTNPRHAFLLLNNQPATTREPHLSLTSAVDLLYTAAQAPMKVGPPLERQS